MKKTVTTIQRILLLIVVVLILVSCLFPPWQWTYQKTGKAKQSEFVGYSFLLAPPPSIRSKIDYEQSNYDGHRTYNIVQANSIDLDRLGLQIGLLVFLGICILFADYIFKIETANAGETKDIRTSKEQQEAKTFDCGLDTETYDEGLIKAINKLGQSITDRIEKLEKAN